MIERFVDDTRDVERVWGVIYAEDFDEEDAVLPPQNDNELVAPEVPDVIEVRFTPEELDEARRISFEDGFQKGAAQQSHSLEQENRTLQLNVLQTLVDNLRSQSDDLAARAVVEAERTARTILAAIAELLPTLCAQHGEAELQQIVQLILPSLQRALNVEISLHPDSEGKLKDYCASLGIAGFRNVMWTRSDTALPGDMHIQWSDGSAERDTSAICSSVTRLILKGEAP